MSIETFNVVVTFSDYIKGPPTQNLIIHTTKEDLESDMETFIENSEYVVSGWELRDD